jgi:hypothetical protein
MWLYVRPGAKVRDPFLDAQKTKSQSNPIHVELINVFGRRTVNLMIVKKWTQRFLDGVTDV